MPSFSSSPSSAGDRPPPRSRERTAAFLGALAATAACYAYSLVADGGAGGAAVDGSHLALAVRSAAASSAAASASGASTSSAPASGASPAAARPVGYGPIDEGPLSNLRELGPPGWVAPGSSNDVPVFWVVPKAGTSTIKSIMSKCLGLTLASSTSLMDYPKRPKKLEAVKVQSGTFVNVDFATPPGIETGKKLGLARSGLADAVATSYIHEAASVFASPPVPDGVVDAAPKGKMFAIFRHPVERMVSDFYYMRGAKHEFRTYDPEHYKELEDYASDPTKHVDNWMVRLLSGKRYGPRCDGGGCPVTDEDYEYARTALKRKCVVLLMDEMEESVRRLVHYGNWTARVKSPMCLANFATKKPTNKNVHDQLESGTDVYEKFREINRYDILLYWYARKLFEEQAARFPPPPPQQQQQQQAQEGGAQPQPQAQQQQQQQQPPPAAQQAPA